MSVCEWESSIKIYMRKEQFDNLLQKLTVIAKDVIIYFTDNTRLAHRMYQKKTLKKKEFILLYYKKNFFPVRRSISEEVLLPKPDFENLVIKNAIIRKILYSDNFVRINLDIEITDIGNKYCLCSEMEYEENSSYSTICEKEKILMSFFFNFLKRNNLVSELLVLDDLTTNDIFESVPNKMKMWYNLQKNEKKYWAYKWNGVKAKMCSSNFGKKIILWEDIKNIIEIQCIELYKQFPFLNNLCIQLEHVNGYYVLTEILSAKFNSKFYMIEPLTNIKLLAMIKKKYSPIELFPNKQLFIQEYFDSEIPNSYDESKFDGFIVIQNEKIVKYKMPTIDMKCLKGNVYAVNTKKFRLDIEGIPGSIYEVSSTFKVLRLRKDRISSGSEKEYEEFIKGCIYFNKYCQ